MSASPAADPTTLRASDAERDEHAGRLGEHAAAGRLTAEEHSERLDTVYAARTRGELAAVLHDLPTVSPGHAPQSREREELSGHLRSFVLVNLLLIAIWAVTGAGYFWPIWPLLGWGIGIASHAVAAGGGRSRLGCGGRRRRAGSRA